MKRHSAAATAALLACAVASAWSCGSTGKRLAATGGSGGNTMPLSTGGSVGPDGSAGKGDLASGGSSGATGGATTSVPPGTGGAGQGGASGAVSGGTTASGGTNATGGASATGGGTGGAIVDAGAGCSCARGTTSWDCYCSAYDCTKTLDYYRPGGAAPWVIAYEEYAGCKLAVVTTKMGPDAALRHVFDLTSGHLVGEQQGTDYPLKCPFGPDSGTFQTLSAGVLGPDPGCARTTCTTTSPLGSVVCGDGGV